MDGKWLSPVPPGQVRTEVNPPSLKGLLIATAATTAAIAATTVALRLFTRFYVTRAKLNVDDYLVTIALIFSFTLLGIIFKQIETGLSYHMWDIEFATYNIWNPLYTVVATIVYPLTISFAKLSILFLYLRLSPQVWFRRIVFALVGVVVCYSVVYVFINVFGCRPISASWDLTIPEGQKTCVDKLTTYMVLSIANIIMDVFILLLPLPIVTPLQMAKRQKASLLLLFGTGALFVETLSLKPPPALVLAIYPDYCWEAVEQFIWCFLEANAGIVCASVPALKPFFMRYLPSFIASRLSSNRGASTAKNSHGLNTVVAQNIERRQMQDESYELSSRDDGKVQNEHEDDDDVKLWSGYQKNAKATVGAQARRSHSDDLESSSVDTLEGMGGRRKGGRTVVVSGGSDKKGSGNGSDGIMVQTETTVVNSHVP